MVASKKSTSDAAAAKAAAAEEKQAAAEKKADDAGAVQPDRSADNAALAAKAESDAKTAEGTHNAGDVFNPGETAVEPAEGTGAEQGEVTRREGMEDYDPYADSLLFPFGSQTMDVVRDELRGHGYSLTLDGIRENNPDLYESTKK